jgi:hypothetical protein
MDPQKERALIERAQTASYTEAEFVTWYDNVLARGGSAALLDAIRLRMRLDFPRAAKRKFGAKTDEVVDALARLHAQLADSLDLSRNTVGGHVKTGGDEQTGKQYICRYLSYKNDRNLGSQITVTQQAADSEIVVTVDHYRVDPKRESLREPQTFPMGDFDSAAALYRKDLVELGVLPKKFAA